MDTLQLVLRLLAFCATFFILLDFIVICTVRTWTAVLGIFAAVFLTIIIFVILRRHTTETCECCGRRQHATLFGESSLSKNSKSKKGTDPSDPFYNIADALNMGRK
jgi:hypothetical protein